MLDEERFENLMVKFYVRGWKNLTVKTLRKFLAFSGADNLNDTDQVDFTEENLTYLWSHSLEFRRQVNDIVMDTVQFNSDNSQEAGLDENFTSTSKPSAARGSQKKSSAS